MIYLVVIALFSNGTRVHQTIPLDSYDACYVRGLQTVDKFEKIPGIETLELSCEKYL